WSYLFASDEIDPLRDFDPDRVKKFNRPLKYYNEEIHVASFALPNFVREIIE
ncbi:MAG: spermidine synthase, partial [Thermotoga sp.]